MAADESGAPSPTLPKGGGAIRGIGEKFAVNLASGTGSMSVPIATSPGRGGFGPQLSLSYDSGGGNGPFGFGWSHSLPAITRKTDKGLPRYDDAAESDVFILSGAEDLVPVQEDELDGYRVRRYRPRIEGLFARIERWSRIGAPTDVHWRSISPTNVLTLYGLTANARIVDPEDPRRIFSWHISETRDDRGNALVYRYKAEDGVRIDLGSAHQRNRGAADDVRRAANQLIKRIQYGNRTPLLGDDGERPRFLTAQQLQNADWMFEVVFDYGDHDPAVPKPGDNIPWPTRPDAFSTYRSGFEVRTARLCNRVLMFHHFPGEPKVGRDCLVRSTSFTYSAPVDPQAVDKPVYSFLESVTQSGHRRDTGGYATRSLPPLEFEYVDPDIGEVVESVDLESVENLPIGIDGRAYRWTDLHGEGIPGVLSEQADSWFYKRNWSAIPQVLPDGTKEARANLAATELVAVRPNASLNVAEFMDLAGDGLPDLVVMDGPVAGLYEHDDAEGWQTFRSFTSRLSRATRDPSVRFVDLDGDGRADVLIAEDDLVWHPSLAEDGFAPAQRVAQAVDEEKGPRVVFAEESQTIFVADLTGDGLADLVRIRNGEICYWPNLGYGRFGAKVTMDNAPRFDTPDQFDPRRIRLADIDGSGTSDIIYIHRDGVRTYFNQSGNVWSQPRPLQVFPRVDDIADIAAIDLFGDGTACLVWSSSLPADASKPMRYVKLMAHGKPHLMTRVINNLGAETRIAYAPSTRFYLQDKREGTPWITRLPFPVHVVERVETYDRISQNRFVTRHAYHHGYFDGEEREFRGFGMVEQWDTESLAALGTLPPSANNAPASHVPPVLTRSWFHTGFYLGRETISKHFEDEYFADAGLATLDDTILPAGLTVDEEREACRALKGSLLRREVYADDAPPNATPAVARRARTPYVASESSFTIRLVQPRGANRHAVFFVHSREAITAHYERQADDPRVEHVVTLSVDAYGNVLQQATIGYGRRHPDASLPTDEDRRKQSLVYITQADNRVTNAIVENDHYRTPLAAESVTYELRKRSQETAAGGVTSLYRFADVASAVAQAADGQHDVKYDDLDFAAAQQAEANDAAEGNRYFRRRIEDVRNVYRPDDCGAAQADSLALLALGQLERHALVGASYKLAFTPGLLSNVFQRPRAGQPDEALLPQPAQVLGGTGADRGGYVDVDGDGHWWAPSGRSFFTTSPADDSGTELQQARQHFYLARRYRDPFDADTLVDYDTPNDLLVVESRDAIGNRLTADAIDYRVLQPRLISDANRNQTEVMFDTLGLVAGTAVMGKAIDNPRLGDQLDAQFDADPPQATIDAFVAKPRVVSPADPAVTVASQEAYALLAHATTRIVYDVTRFMRVGEAPFAATIARETHVSELAAGGTSKLQISFAYSDGFGREIQKKVQAEPGPLLKGGPDINPRWVGSGWTIFNNKGKPVRQYEPFFTGSNLFAFNATVGVSPVLFYDPIERLVATIHPNRTYVKVMFDAWQHVSYDVNDTCAPRNAETGDPRTDPDVGGYVRAYFQTQPANWQTWRAQRSTGSLGADEQVAAARAAAHADTPTTAYFDSLGRTFLTIARNRVVCAGHDLDGTETAVASRVDIDIEGNQRAVRDERALPANGLPTGTLEERVVVRSTFDMLGNVIHTVSMEAGERWTLEDVGGKPIRGWDSRGHNFATSYDTLRRQVAQWLRGTTADSDPRTLNQNIRFGAIEYGEPLPNAEALNLRTRTYRRYDAAGELTSARLNANGDPVEAYDFKGNLRVSTRRLAKTYSGIPDWSQNRPPQLDAERFEGRTRYDALNRSLQAIATFSSVVRTARPNRINVVQHAFNDASLLERVDVWLERAADPAALLDPGVDAPTAALGVRGIAYDAKGQRQQIDYGNGASTSYEYDQLTFRLMRLSTAAGASQIQDLNYTYDPAGNVSHIRDDAQQTIFFRNQRVDPNGDYVYDALYRLIQADGREHLGQTGGPIPHSYDDASRSRIRTADAGGHFAPNDKGAMGTYTERYVYDAVGNFLQMQHERSDAAVPGWARRYTYAAASLIEPAKVSNRLTSTRVGNGPNEVYGYDAHGNLLQMPQLQEMRWDFNDQLQLTRRQRVNDEDAEGVAREGERTFYVYDASGQRVRKVTEASGGGVKDERIYFGGSELYRAHDGAAGPVSAATATFERETLHLMDDTRRIAMVETRSLDTAGIDTGPRQLIRYQLANHLGSASLELDDAAEFISYEEYSPYGSTTYQATRSVSVAWKRYRYVGSERDEESGLNYHSARYYALWLGRWVSADPSGTNDGVNLYSYCRNTPIAHSDVSGRQTPPTVGSPPTIQDYFYYLRDTGGFWAADTPKGGPPRFTGSQGAPFGVQGHAQTEAAANAVRALPPGEPLRSPLIDRIQTEVAIEHGTNQVLKVGGSPIRGAHNIDAVANAPNAPNVKPGDVVQPGQFEADTDFKFGRGSITQAHGQFAQQPSTTGGASPRMTGPSLGPASESEQAFAVLNQELQSTPQATPPNATGPSFNAAGAKATWNALKQAKTAPPAPATPVAEPMPAEATPAPEPAPAASPVAGEAPSVSPSLTTGLSTVLFGLSAITAVLQYREFSKFMDDMKTKGWGTFGGSMFTTEENTKDALNSLPPGTNVEIIDQLGHSRRITTSVYGNFPDLI